MRDQNVNEEEQAMMASLMAGLDDEMDLGGMLFDDPSPHKPVPVKDENVKIEAEEKPFKLQEVSVKLEDPSVAGLPTTPVKSSSPRSSIANGFASQSNSKARPQSELVQELLAGLEGEFGVESWEMDVDDDDPIDAKPVLVKPEQQDEADKPVIASPPHIITQVKAEASTKPALGPHPTLINIPQNLHDFDLEDFSFTAEFLSSPTPSPEKPLPIGSAQEYPIPNPRIHSTKGKGKATEYQPVPWIRAKVSSVVKRGASLSQQGQRWYGGGEGSGEEKLVVVKDVREGREWELVLKGEFSAFVVNVGECIVFRT